MQASQKCLDLIKACESLRLEAYLCPAEVWTIGWGHTGGVYPGQRITEAQAEFLLGQDVAAVERDLARVIEAPLTQGQWDALVSLCFNLRGGAARLPHVAPRLVADIGAQNFTAAADELLDMDRANGVVLPGLKRRRQAERALFLS